MILTDYEMKVSDKEYAILNSLYDFRVMTTEQIRKIHFEGKGYYVNKVLMNMRKKQLIKSSILKNSRKGKKGYAYHRLTETGLECLEKHGKPVEGRSSIYAKPKQVAYLLMVSDLVSELVGTQWEIWDSRKVKKEFNLDMRMNIQGLVISPDKKRYGLYILSENTSPKTIGKIQSEIRTNAHNLLNDYLILAKGKKSFVDFADTAINKDEQKQIKPLYTGYSVKIYPYIPYIKKANAFRSEAEWIRKLCDYYDFNIKTMDFSENRQSFPIIVEYQGMEWYLVDLTDSDINKYRDIEVYSKSVGSRNWEQREIIVISFGVPTQMNYKLRDMPGVHQIVISADEFSRLCTN